MDIKTVHRRTENEGESFLTITLPAYCSGLERGLDRGLLEPSMVSQFHWHRRGLPEFLRGFLLLIFSTDGRLLPVPSIEAIHCVRQILLAHKKIQRECDDRRTTAAMRKYRETDDEVPTRLPDGQISDLYRSVSRVVVADLFRHSSHDDVVGELHPHHGPGATAEQVRGNSKYLHKQWHERLERVFPFTEYGLASVRNLEINPLDGVPVNFVAPEDEQPVRVVFVPKTMKTPRVIAIEPVCMQYMQQALLRCLVPRVESGTYTGGKVNFSDQSINARLALEASKDRRLATIDLSEASDRVSLAHVEELLSVYPDFREMVMACRSTRAKLPDGEVITLRKFASMGSALCFPMEALVFFCTIVAGRLQRRGLRPTGPNIMKCSVDLYVYGDDIIVPADEAPSVCSDLETFGLKVNRNKSFWSGSFRESCGVDAYAGDDVTVTYVRHEQPTDRRHAENIVSWVATANQFYLKGFWQTAKKMRDVIQRLLGKLPHLAPHVPGLGWVTYSKATQFSRWNKDLMNFEVKTWVPKPLRTRDPLEGDSALMKCFTVIGAKAQVAVDHLIYVVARGKLALTRRWVPSL